MKRSLLKLLAAISILFTSQASFAGLFTLNCSLPDSQPIPYNISLLVIRNTDAEYIRVIYQTRQKSSSSRLHQIPLKMVSQDQDVANLIFYQTHVVINKSSKTATISVDGQTVLMCK